MRRNTVIVAVLLVSAAGAFAAGEKITLKPKYLPDTYLTTMTTDMNIVTEMAPGQSIDQDMKMVMVMETTVDKPDAKGQMMHVTYKRVKQSVTSPFMIMLFDSEDPDGQSSPMASTWKAMLDKTLHVTLDPKGKVIEITGMEKMWDEMARGNPAMAPMVNNMKKQFGDKMIKDMFGQAEKMMPKKPVARGETWIVDIDVPMPMMGQGTKLRQKCTLKAIEITPAGKVAVVGFVGKFSSDQAATAPSSQPADPLPMKFTKMDMDQSGTMRVHLDNTIRTDTTTKMTGDMAMSVHAPDRAGQGQETQMKIKLRGAVKMTVVPGKYKKPTTRPATAPSSGEDF